MAWYLDHKPRVLAFTPCPKDGKRIALTFARGDRLYLWDAGYRMTPAESRREEIALQVGVIWDALDRAPTEEEYDQITAETGGRFAAQPRVRPLLPVPVITTCPRCRGSYELDITALTGANGNVPPIGPRTLDDAVANRMLREHGSVQGSEE